MTLTMAKRRGRAMQASIVERLLEEQRRQRDPAHFGPPTPELVRQHRKSSFARLCDAGKVTGEMMQAAQEIEAVYMALTRGLLARAQTYERTDPSARKDMPLAIALAFRDRYKPWADLLSARKKRGGPPALEIVTEIVIHQGWLREEDQARGWRRDTAKRILLRALLEYAVMAGWASAGELVRFDAIAA